MGNTAQKANRIGDEDSTARLIESDDEFQDQEDMRCTLLEEARIIHRIQYSFLGCTAVSIRLNTTFRGLAPSPSSGKTDLTYNSSVPCFSTCRGRENQTGL